MEFALWLKECLPEEETVGPVGGSAGVVGAHKFTEGDYFLFPFRRVSRLRRPFVLRPPRRRAGQRRICTVTQVVSLNFRYHKLATRARIC